MGEAPSLLHLVQLCADEFVEDKRAGFLGKAALNPG